MHLTFKRPEFETPNQRQDFATLVSKMFPSTHTARCFEPYKPNEFDDYFWTVDTGNDYKVKFFREDPTKVEILYRYFDIAKMKALAEWLKVVTYAKELVLEPYELEKLNDPDS